MDGSLGSLRSPEHSLTAAGPTERSLLKYLPMDILSESKGFKGLRVVSFESRKSDQMADLIRRNGGEAILAPSMREVPLEDNTDAFAFGEKLLKGEYHLVAFLTGVGTKTLFDTLKSKFPFEKIKEALLKTMLASRS